MTKRYIFILYLLCSALTVFGQAAKKTAVAKPTLEEYVETMKVASELRHASWSIRVVNLKTSEVVVSYNEQMSLMPASNMKVITSGIGLLLLGEDYRFKTRIVYDGIIRPDSVLQGDIYIVGGGDPSLGSSVFATTRPDSVFSQWTKALKNAGIRAVEGGVIADATQVFDQRNRHESWQYGDIGVGYGAGVSGIQFADNRMRLRVLPGTIVGSAGVVTVSRPDIPGITIVNDVTTLHKDSLFNVSIFGAPHTQRIVVTGGIPINRATYLVDAAIPNTAIACAWSFDDYLNRNGVKTRKSVSEASLPQMKKPTEVTIYYSPNLVELVREINKSSNNSYAESLFKVIGHEKGGGGTFEHGSKSISRALWVNRVPSGGYKQYDGSGLSRKNMVTTKFMCDFMEMINASPSAEAFEKSLAVAGVDGTMRTTLTKGAAYKNIRAKSGSLEAVRGYTGYATAKNGDKLCFSVLVNNYTCPSGTIAKHLEALMEAVVEVR